MKKLCDSMYRMVCLLILFTLPVMVSAQTIDLPPNFTQVNEDDGLGNIRTVFVTSVMAGTAPVTVDFNVTGGGPDPTWSITSPSCSSGSCASLGHSIDANNGQFTFTPKDQQRVEFDLTVAAGGSPVTQFIRINITRNPVDIVFVLDKSGSMSISSSGAITRWNALTTAVGAFVDKLEASRVDGDRIAITYFHSNVQNGLGTTSSPLIAVTDPGASPSSKLQVQNSLLAHGPAGLTAMGEGLLDAKSKHTIPPKTTHTRIVLLFTDGYQNWGRLVTSEGTSVSDGTPINDGTGPGSISIYTIGIGAAGSLPAILAAIANNNRGKQPPTTTIPPASASWNTQTGNESAFVQDFTNAFKSMLEQFSPQIIGAQRGTLDRTSNPADTITFSLNKNVSHLLCELYSPVPLPVSIEREGVKVNPTYVRSGLGYQTLVFKFPGTVGALRSEGQWKVLLNTGTSISTAPTHNIRVIAPYTVIALTDDPFLDYRCSPGASKFTVGDNLKPTVQLRYKGVELTDASVQAILLKPGQDLGNLLATTEVKIDTANLSSADPGSPGNQKYEQLLNDPAFLAKMLPQEQSMVLSHSSQGVYEAPEMKLDTSGVYRMIFFLNDTLTGGDIIERREEQSFYVQFGEIDLPASQPVLQGSGTQWVLTLQPKTTQDLYIGPAFHQTFALSASGITLQDVTDKGDGTYELKFQGDPEAKVNITLLGTPVFEGVLNDITCYGPNAGLWLKIKCWLLSLGLPLWLVFLILILLLFLIWWIMKK